MATDTPTRPSADADEPRGRATRIRLQTVFKPLPTEFWLIAGSASALTVFGLVMILSATSATAGGENPFDAVLKQLVFAAIGLPVMFLASRMPIKFWKKIAWPLLGAAILFQLLVFTPLGYENDGNRNWIRLFGLQAQPSEFLKIALALWIGAVLARKQALLGRPKHVLIPLVPVAVLALGTVIAGHDLGTVIILAMVVLACLFFSGVSLRIFTLPVIGAIAGIAYFAMSPDRQRRITSLFSEQCLESVQMYQSYDCYQPMHGLWGLASGGIFGLGLGNSKEKYDWLPAAANDYIFAIIGEELGLIGCLVVLILFAVLAVGMFRLVRRSDDLFVRIVTGGVAVWIIGQALVNIGVVVRLLPVLGVPLPFMSQGGTSLMSGLIGCGVLLAFARRLPTESATDRGRIER